MLDTEEIKEEEQLEEDFELKAFLQKLEREKQRDKKRPDVNALEDAIHLVDEAPQLKLSIGQSILIERFTEYNKTTRWFDTRTYEIKAVDLTTGAVRLYDVENKCYAATNYITGFSNPLYKFKIPNSGKIKNKVKYDIGQKSPVKKSKDGLRTVYSSKNVIHTRISGIAYGPQGTTKAIPGTKLKMSLSINSTILVEDPENKWSETWCQISL